MKNFYVRRKVLSFRNFHFRIKDKIEYVRSLKGNDKCCDCDADGPEWASINLGILLCLNCGGAHRSVLHM